MSTVLLHGFTGGPESFRDIVAGAGLGASAFTPWLPGHGAAPHRVATGRFDDAVDDLARAIPFAEPCTLLGYSMGARVALRLLVRHADRFARAILVGAHPGLDDDDAKAERRRWEQGLAALLATGGLAAFVDAWEALPVLLPARAVPAARLAHRRAVRMEHTPQGLAHALAVLGLAAMPGTTAALPHIAVPVTFVVGAEDDKFRAVAHTMAARLPAARVVEVPRAGHDVVLEAPEALIPLLGGRPS